MPEAFRARTDRPKGGRSDVPRICPVKLTTWEDNRDIAGDLWKQRRGLRISDRQDSPGGHDGSVRAMLSLSAAWIRQFPKIGNGVPIPIGT
jgi:hypothetical protein